MSVHKDVKKVTTHTLQEMKNAGVKISMLTGYDFSMARIIDEAGIDVILVGDSASNVMAGHETTLPITLDQMIYHASSVVRAVSRSLVVVDMPFGSYQGNSKEALNSAIRIMKEAEAHAVKLEGGEEVVESIKRILTAGIPVMGHLGFTPQSVHAIGGFKVQGRGDSAKDLLEQAMKLQNAGVFALVLEMVPTSVAEAITKGLTIPTIGIGAGNQTDGQILVWQDFAGLSTGSRKFVKQYAQLRDDLANAARAYRADVQSSNFPSKEHSFED
jgi:3-methyl-2-oxobutanoate hydroxymethyltransferase